MPGSSAWLTRSTPTRLTSSTRCHRPSSVSLKKENSSLPALLTSTVGTPNASPTAATASRTEPPSVTSIANASPSISEATSRAFSSCRSHTATRAPSAASRRDVAAPMPLAPPVTSAVSPSSRIPDAQPTRVTTLTHTPDGPPSKFPCMSLPPGPRTPAALQMAEWIMRPVPFIERCRERYGDFFTVRFVFGNIIWICDPDVIKRVFTGDPDVLHAGEGNAAPLEPIMGKHSVLLLDEPEHMRQRKLMLPSFHGERMQRYGEQMQAITDREVDRWPVGTVFPLRMRTQAITLEVIMRTVFGVRE